MQFITVLTIAGVLGAAGATGAQEPPPPVQSSAPPTVGAPPSQSPSQTQTVPPPATAPAPTPAAADAAPVAPPRPFTTEELRLRRGQIYLMEGVLMNAVKLAAQYTASEIRRIEPNIVMFSSSPVRAHGTHLEGYGVLFQVEIPSVIPSVASLVETVQRQRARPNTSPAQPTAISGGSSSEALMDPDAHYVESVKQQLINAMVRLSNSMELRPEEWLAVEARDGTEAPGQLSQPSTMMLRIKGSDLAEYFAGRITIEEARRRVQVSGF